MKAGLLRAPNRLDLVDVPDPERGPGDMILKMRAATICGTDLRIFRGRKTAGVRYPSVIGHEFAGEIAEPPEGGPFRAGQRVCVDPAIPCGHCTYCKLGHEHICENLTAIGYEVDGAFAEYVRIPARAVEAGNVHLIPDDLPYEQAALAEPFACVLNGQERVGVSAGEAVVVLGAGPIGLLHVKLARLSGARSVIVSEPSAGRRQAARDAGADIAVDPSDADLPSIVKDATRGVGADVAIVAIGVPALADAAIGLVRRRGRVNLFAGFSIGDSATMDINSIHYREILVTGSFGLSRLHFERALDLIASRRIDLAPFVTHRFGLAGIGEALATAEGGSAIKVAILS